MFSFLRTRFGIPGVIAVIALVFGMLGGAYGATDHNGRATASKKSSRLSAKQKKEVETIAKKFQGTGPAGANGSNGSNGANGSSGAKGDKGEKGEQGKQGNQGNQGIPGDPWTAGGILPANATETGIYSAPGQSALGVGSGTLDKGKEVAVPASFDIPVVPAPEPVFVPGPLPAAGFGKETKGTGNLTSGEKKVTGVSTTSGEFVKGAPIKGTGVPAAARIAKVISATELELTQNASATGTGVALTASEGCPGVTVEGVPQAAAGKLCVYGLSALVFGFAEVESATVKSNNPAGGEVTGDAVASSSPAGTALDLSCPDGGAFEACIAKGLWAVTGE